MLVVLETPPQPYKILPKMPLEFLLGSCSVSVDLVWESLGCWTDSVKGSVDLWVSSVAGAAVP